MWGHALDRAGPGQGQVMCMCAHSIEASGAVKWEFRDYLRTGSQAGLCSMEKLSNEMYREMKISRWFLVNNMQYNSRLQKLQQ